MKYVILLLLLVSSLQAASQPAKRKLRPEDVYRIKNINDISISPDGAWIVYPLTSIDSAKDKRNTDLWMVNWEGTQQLQLTYTPDSESEGKFSPDGKYISFTSSRQGAKGSQVWLLDRRGGEARKLTDVRGNLSDYLWSPDGMKLLMVIQDPPDTSKTKTTKPIVINQYQFKADVQGYLTAQRRHLYLFDLATNKLDTLTKGVHHESSPAFSPDSKEIVFVSNRSADPQRNENTDLWIMEARKGAVPRQLTTWKGSDEEPAWSPDGKTIAYLRSNSEENFLMYENSILAVIPREGGTPRLLTLSADRPVTNLAWSPDSKNLFMLVSDDREDYVGQLEVASGKLNKVAGGQRSFSYIQMSRQGKMACLMSEPNLPTEVYALDGATPRRLTHHQDAFVAPLQLAAVSGYTSKSKDGTIVSNILFRAPGLPQQKQPTLFYIHGGPVAQDSYGFDLHRQMLAAAGYNVVAVNYRGSNGRGLDYARAIYADWGNKEVMDIHGAVDQAIKDGVADPDRLGIGGWSYGGILTDYSIATDTRFKAAVSGAGSAMQLSLYGHDQYVRQYDTELGTPWKNPDLYLKLSYPFLKADRIKTPTLFVSGEKDFNVPVTGSEQMYQALRTQGIPTELVIYPGQFHGISVPSYLVDRYHRYIEWYDKYLKGITPVKVDKEIHSK